MASVIITSYFSRGGQPATNIATVSGGTFPVVRIWEVVDGTPSGDAFIGEFVMIPMEDGVNIDGFYKYEFMDIPDGYDETKTYTFRADGGTTIPSGERYQVARLDPSENLDPDAISDAVWAALKVDNLDVGSMGEALTQTHVNSLNIVNKLYLEADSVQELVNLLLKYQTNRTKIDPTTNTLTVYDSDCVTVLRQFKLYDSVGSESVSNVCERVPKNSTDGLPVCP